MFEFASCPDALLLVCAFSIDDKPDAMLRTIYPLASITASIRISVRSGAVLFVESIFTLVFPAVLPYVVTIAVHDSVLEAALEVSAISPLEASVTAHLVI